MFTVDPSHRKQCKRYDIPGHAHYLTFSCFQRQAFLTRDRTRRWLCDAIRAAKKKQPFDLWAFVIMPEHAHLLVFPHERATISGILKSVKQPVAQRALHWVQANAPTFLPKMADPQPNGQLSYRFWQRGGGYDRNIWSLEEVIGKVRYIHENPLRRGLVERPEQWPWSSWRAWEYGVSEPLPIDSHSLPWASG
jgi:putative transposase